MYCNFYNLNFVICSDWLEPKHIISRRHVRVPIRSVRHTRTPQRLTLLRIAKPVVHLYALLISYQWGSMFFKNMISASSNIRQTFISFASMSLTLNLFLIDYRLNHFLLTEPLHLCSNDVKLVFIYIKKLYLNEI